MSQSYRFHNEGIKSIGGLLEVLLNFEFEYPLLITIGKFLNIEK